MAKPGGSVVITGDDAGVQRMLHTLDTALNPIAIAAFLKGSVAPYLQTRAKRRFELEGDDVTGAWQPLAPATEEIRSSSGYPAAHPINRRSGELEDYIVNGDGSSVPTALGGTLVYPEFTPLGDLGSKLRVAQQGGSQPGYRDTPARPVLGVNEVDLSFVLLALSYHIKGQGGLMG